VFDLYFQYTHFSNMELNQLRQLLSTWNARMRLTTSAKMNSSFSSIAFGKLLIITISSIQFKLDNIELIVKNFPALKLVFILSGTFILFPKLYTTYQNHPLLNCSKPKLLGLSYILNSIRYIFFHLRIRLLNLLILFKETTLYKLNLQIIC